MAVRLRLRRIGRKKKPIYQIVAADSRAARNGKFLEIVGRYEPLQNPLLVGTKEDRVMYWLKNGARPTDTVRSLFKRNGLWLKWNLKRRGIDDAKIATELEKWQMAQDDRRQREQERKARRSAARKKAKHAGAPTEASTSTPEASATAPA